MDQMDRLETKIDDVIKTLSEQNATLAVHSQLHLQNSKDLEVHIKRTDLLEAMVADNKRNIQEDLELALSPIKTAKFLAKAGAVITGIVSAVMALKHFFKG